MPRIGEVTGDDLKTQLSEYHVLVAEVIGGLLAELTTQTNRVTTLESKLRRLSTAPHVKRWASYLLWE